MKGSIYLDIDASDLEGKLKRLEAVMKPEEFRRAMIRIYARTGQHVRKVLKTDLPHDYQIKPGEVGAAVGAARTNGWSCSIPVRGSFRKIGREFRASGGIHGWNALKARKKSKINGKIVKAGASTLPDKMRSYAGFPPFRNLGSKLMPQTYTRSSKARGPLLIVSGIAIPQMPMNRSQDEVQKDIKDWMEKRIDHEFSRLLKV